MALVDLRLLGHGVVAATESGRSPSRQDDGYHDAAFRNERLPFGQEGRNHFGWVGISRRFVWLPIS
jgi:hypothetical protein